MRFGSSLLAAAATLSTANAAHKGFNYGAFFLDQSPKHLVDFEYEFNAAKQLPGTNGEFNSARLYTMLQWGTSNTVIEAIQAAINTKTTLLLGLWASAGTESFNNEITALKAAIDKYGQTFADLVVGISVGSEDLYRITPTGIENESGPGAQPNELVRYIQQTRSAIAGTVLASKPIGHVDTWTAYVNGSNSAVISALDWVGVDAYPYFQKTLANSIGNANATFYDALDQTIAVSQGKPVWVTETGWPVSGPQQNQAVASAENAGIYWEDVTCSLTRNNVNLWYYTLQDAQNGQPSPSFGLKPAGDLFQVNALFDLSCSASSKPSPTVSLIGSSSLGLPTDSGLPFTSITVPLILPTPTLPPPALPPVLSPPPHSLPSLLPLPPPPPPPPPALPSTLPSLPPLVPVIPNVPPKPIQPPFEAPHLIVPVNKADPHGITGNKFTAQISPTYSTLFVFDVSPRHAGKNCDLVFHLPTPFPAQFLIPYKLLSPGGISLARLDSYATILSANETAVSKESAVGTLRALAPGQFNLGSGPCEAGKTVSYRADAIGGLNLEFFQMTDPAIGLFMQVSG